MFYRTGWAKAEVRGGRRKLQSDVLHDWCVTNMLLGQSNQGRLEQHCLRHAKQIYEIHTF
jgi:hypothetical protein